MPTRVPHTQEPVGNRPDVQLFESGQLAPLVGP